MDGEGRFLRPLAVAAEKGVAAGSVAGSSNVSASIFGVMRGRRRRSRARDAAATSLEQYLPRGTGSALTIGFLAAVSIYGIVLGGHMEDFRQAYGEPQHAVARALGFGINQINISGLVELSPTEVLGAAGISPKISLALLDAAEVRRRLELVPLIKEASVRKLYPNELSISITERQPHALWQQNGELFVIATDGTVIDMLNDARFARLPLVVGDQANVQSKDYLKLREEAGPLKSRIRAGILVAGRRWDLKLDNGVDIRLPEEGAGAALSRLAAMERDQHILDKDILSVDMRMGDRLVVRLSEEAAQIRADRLNKKPNKQKGPEI
ncbi:MAG: FtsQ-type POTRA domain-containing protein [Chelatococcus sp.]|jgi:cell division protein FtsQ|nr:MULTISPECIES: cell division protein FtsQ/DivIB [unclassified Chelatococcus]CAH1666476.1 Cell division protein ftsQ [Hyphomicrobiales bacterium]MBS7737860.1 FtsQ-type POTRA domain-containing protein [Chelatococcus sp. HY11]MBX3538827.1 FtsQ-type POTRA domain-containing protein [Chelatococcus sp.]MBX3546692.1 FtsQ-type POTRA domain-containing protein [Chelatococcus sp.]MCO5079314.1 FtsQ-type POTRA domain-containing protein [Chelatococcus sp.]